MGHGPFPTELQNETQSLEVRYGNFWDYRNACYAYLGLPSKIRQSWFWGDEVLVSLDFFGVMKKSMHGSWEPLNQSTFQVLHAKK